MEKISVFQEELKSMSKFRYSLIHKQNEKTASDDELKQIDAISDEIVNYIKSHFEFLSFDFIMEELSKLGWCPNLLNDDNGHWAISCKGIQNVVFGDEPEDVHTTVFVEAKYWKKTPKEALLFYLIDDNDE
jgi:hypothetical protein